MRPNPYNRTEVMLEQETRDNATEQARCLLGEINADEARYGELAAAGWGLPARDHADRTLRKINRARDRLRRAGRDTDPDWEAVRGELIALAETWRARRKDRLMRIETPEHGRPYVALYQTPEALSAIGGLTPVALALFLLSLDQMDGTGHCPFGRSLIDRLAARLPKQPTGPTVSRALRELKDARLITEDSKRDCIVVFADVAQKGRGNTRCPIHGASRERQWWSGSAPVRKQSTRKVEIPTAVETLVDADTGELLGSFEGRKTA